MSKFKKWNFRVATKEYVGIGIREQIFSIIEVYYNKAGKPKAYANASLESYDSPKELKWTNKKIKKAFKLPVLDLDNWPHKYKK